MSGSVEDTYDALIWTLKNSDYTKEECLLIISEYTKFILANNLPLEQRLPAALTTNDFVKRVRDHEWKFAHGFFGNWAESTVDQKDQDVGC